ncbi:hypothetical protein [Lacunimicrobium album]
MTFCLRVIVIFLAITLPLAAQTPRSTRTYPHAHASADVAIEQAHSEIWRRFVDKQGIMLDFADLNGDVSIPTPEECQLGKPNALGWWSPIENGGMFNGMYLDAIVNRYQQTKSPEDAEKARRLVQGLLLLNSISDTTGFVGRGVSTDDKSHYAMGSNDQTFPWFIGLAVYLDSGIATQEEVERIKQHVVTTADVLLKLNWNVPAEPPFHLRGSFAPITFESSPRLLFILKFVSKLTQEPAWEARYQQSLRERGGPDMLTRLEVCQRGLVYEHGPYHSWTSCSCVWAIRELWEMETDESLRAAYSQGLQSSAELAFKNVSWASRYDNDNKAQFEMNWRMMNEYWVAQSTQKEASDLAMIELKAFNKVSPRRQMETELVREPTSAAWIVSLTPDKTFLRAHSDELKDLIRHYDYTRLYYSQYFWAESAWYRLQKAVN